MDNIYRLSVKNPRNYGSCEFSVLDDLGKFSVLHYNLDKLKIEKKLNSFCKKYHQSTHEKYKYEEERNNDIKGRWSFYHNKFMSRKKKRFGGENTK